MSHIVITEGGNNVVVTEGAEGVVVTAVTAGPQGPPGATGPQGPQGVGAPSSMGQLTDVDTSAKVNNSLIYYNAASGTFKADAVWTTDTIVDGSNF